MRLSSSGARILAAACALGGLLAPACGDSSSGGGGGKDAGQDVALPDAAGDTGLDAAGGAEAGNDASPDVASDGSAGADADVDADASDAADAEDPGWTSVTLGSGEPRAMAYDNGVLFVAGYTFAPDSAWRIVALDASDGSTLWSKDENLHASDPALKPESANGIALDANNIYVVGNENKNKFGSLKSAARVEARSRVDGALVWSVPFDYTTEDDVGNGVAVDATGVYVAAGSSVSYGSLSSWRLLKLAIADGSSIWAVDEFLSFKGQATAVVAADGDVFFAGQYDDGTTKGWRVERRQQDNSLVWHQEAHMSAWFSLRSLAVHTSGVYAAGAGDLASAPGYYNFRVQKLGLDGSPGWSDVEDLSPSSDVAQSVSVDDSGAYVVGVATPALNDTAWRLERRALASGTPDWTHDENPGAGSDSANTCVVVGNWLYVAGVAPGSSGGLEWTVQKRPKSTGAP